MMMMMMMMMVMMMTTRWWFHLYFHPYLDKCSNLANIFRMGWNHQLDDVYDNDDDVYDNDVDEVTLTIIDEILFGIEVFIEQSPLFF